MIAGWRSRYFAIALLTGAIMGLSAGRAAWAQGKKPNIVVNFGDDIGWFNIGAYHRA